jgi:hypothetical protein
MRYYMMRIILALSLAWAALALSITPAHANALSDGWNCAKKAGMSSASIGKDLYKKGEALATKAGPIAICLGKTGPEAQALAVTSSSLTALRIAKPSLLGNQCEARIKGIATKPFANGLASLLPASGAKNQLISAASSDTANQLVWDQIGQLPPPFSSVPNQIECGCLMSDAGLSMTDVSEVTNAISDTSASCAKALDSLGLGFINQIGSYAIGIAVSLVNGLSDNWDEWKGQSDPGAPGAMYDFYFGDHMLDLASRLANTPGTTWNTAVFSHDTAACASSGQYEYCKKTIPQIRNECVAYYDDHKMSKANATKVCDGYQTAMVGAATALSKQYIGRGALPSLIAGKMPTWVKEEWLWRTPKGYVPGNYDFDNGHVSGYSVNKDGNGVAFLTNALIKILGSPGYKKNAAAWDYQPSGIYATARSLVIELGNDPAKAQALAFAAATDPVRDELRAMWNKDRKYVAYYHLRDWYPKQAFGFRYGCSSGETEAACAAAMEAKFDKICFAPMSELYVTGISGIGFPARYAKVKTDCTAQMQPILAAAAKLDANLGQATQGLCSATGTRDEQAACNADAIKNYYECASIALKQGKDDASQCLAGRKLGADIFKQLQKGLPKPGNTPQSQPQSRPKPEEPPSRKP